MSNKSNTPQDLPNCLCCHGNCDCEYGCVHPHGSDEIDEGFYTPQVNNIPDIEGMREDVNSYLPAEFYGKAFQAKCLTSSVHNLHGIALALHSQLKEAKAENSRMRSDLEYFIKRCEEGSMLSVKTYARFKETVEALSPSSND